MTLANDVRKSLLGLAILLPIASACKKNNAVVLAGCDDAKNVQRIEGRVAVLPKPEQKSPIVILVDKQGTETLVRPDALTERLLESANGREIELVGRFSRMQGLVPVSTDASGKRVKSLSLLAGDKKVDVDVGELQFLDPCQ